jgi:hypothetical protein
MARTFKQYGCAHDTTGSLNVAVSIDGTQVYNGAVTADTEPHDSDFPQSELFTFELAEDVSGDTAWSVTVTGSEGAYVNLGEVECNMVNPETTIPLTYFTDKIATFTSENDMFTAEQQTYIDTTLGDSLSAEVRAKLQAGTSKPIDDARVVMEANETGNMDPAQYETATKVLSNGQLDSEALTVADTAPSVGAGEVLTMTANLTIPTFEYNPPLPE